MEGVVGEKGLVGPLHRQRQLLGVKEGGVVEEGGGW